MRSLIPLGIAVAALVLAGCAPAVDSTTPAETAQMTLTPEPTPEETPSPTGGPTAEPTPTGAGFENPQECQNTELGITVSYPGDWWVNQRVEAEAPVADIPACTYFALKPVELHPGTDDLSGVAIRLDEMDREPPVDGELVDERETTVDGRDAMVVEFEPEPQPGFVSEGERILRYVVAVGDDRFLIATTDTINQDEGDYEESTEVLEAMMETLVFDGLVDS